MKNCCSWMTAILFSTIVLLPGGYGVPETWQKGDEILYTGHTFDESMWTNDSISFEAENGIVTFAMSYVKHGDVQAFLIAFRDYRNGTNVSTLPYQMFGLHYYTPRGHDVFIGAILAFLMAYNDTYNGTASGQNGLPDPGHEKVFFVLPFGAGDILGGNDSYAPEVDVIPVMSPSPGVYRFGMIYRNLYAVVFENPFLSAVLKTGWIARFKEFTITYQITVDDEKGIVRAETFYTIGQITELWLVVLGVPVKADPNDIPDTMGLSVVHYAVIFSSRYRVVNREGRKIETNITAETDNLTIQVGNDNERAFEIGFRGTFDLYDNSTLMVSDQKAYNVLLRPRSEEYNFIKWQAGFSLDLFCTIAYAMSDFNQQFYRNPRLFALLAGLTFREGAFWYAVAFPQWKGYKIVHDPVYTAYMGPRSKNEEEKIGIPGFDVLLAVPAVLTSFAIWRIRSVWRR